MNALERWHETRVIHHSAAILMRISQLMGDTLDTFETCRDKALKEHTIPRDIAKSVKGVVYEYDATDIHPEDRKRRSRAIYFDGVAKGGHPDTWLNRILWKLFSVTL